MDYTYGPMLLLAKDITIPLFIYGLYFYVKMAKYKSLVSTLFIYNKICENVKKLENFEISTYLGEKKFSRVQNFLRGDEGLHTLRLQFLEGGGSKHPLCTLDGCADLLGGEAQF